MTVWVTKKSPDLATAVDRWRQELSPSAAEQLIDALAVVHPEDHLTAHLIRIFGHCQGHRWLSRSWLAASHEQHPVPHQVQHNRCAAILAVDRSVENVHIPVATGRGIGDDEHVRQRLRLEPFHAVDRICNTIVLTSGRYEPDPRRTTRAHPREIPWAVTRRMLNSRSATFKAFTNPKALTKLPDINNRRILGIELPSVNGTGTARALATVYGVLAIGGERLGVTAETLAEIKQPQRAAPDLIFGIESAFRFGFMKAFPILEFGTSPAAFGHTGSGGSFAYADPATGLGYAYVMNRAGYGLPTDPREVALRAAVTRSLT